MDYAAWLPIIVIWIILIIQSNSRRKATAAINAIKRINTEEVSQMKETAKKLLIKIA